MYSFRKHNKKKFSAPASSYGGVNTGLVRGLHSNPVVSCGQKVFHLFTYN